MKNFIIDKEYIKRFSPCKDRWENYLKHYSGFSGSIIEFLDLREITWDDKKWLLFHERQEILPESLLREFALICACRAVENCDSEEIKDYFDMVLHIFISGNTDLLSSNEYLAADRAANRAAYMAADRAAYWSADRAANRAAYMAAYMEAYVAADRAADRAAYVAAEENIQREILIDLVSKQG